MKKVLVLLALAVAIVLCLASCGHEHSFGEWTTTKAPSCSQDGEQARYCSCGEIQTRAIIATNHKWTEATCKAPKTCSDCGKTEGVAIEHSWTNATCTTPKTCENCKTTDGEAVGHTFGQWTTTKEPTCVDGGEMKRICSTCGYEDKSYINPVTSNHKPVTDSAVPATCTETGLTEGSHCELCPVIIKAQEVIPAKGHTKETVYGYDSTCTKTGLTNGEKCSVCHVTLLAQQEIPLKDHTFDDEYDGTCNNCSFMRDPKCRHSNTEPIPGYPATCTVDGYEDGLKCLDCQETLLERKLIPATGHTEEAIPAVPATCYSTGLTAGVKCKICSDILKAQETIKKLEHTPAKAVEENRIEATCTEAGSYDLVVYCSVEKCKYKISSEHKTLAPLGHTLGAGATCTTAQICTVCKATITPSLGHDWKEATCTEPKICQRTECGVTDGEAKGHSFGEWVTVKQATTTEEGLKERTCACGEKETEIVPTTYSIGLKYTLNSDGESYSVTGIGDCTDNYVAIPDTNNGLPVTAIGEGAFDFCNSMFSVVIPDSVISIGRDAFYCCYMLYSVVIPDSVTSIGYRAFSECTWLHSVVIGDSVTSIDYEAFLGCDYLENISVSAGNTKYKDIDGNLYTKDGKTLVQYAIGKMDTSFVIPEGVTTIGDRAFYDCDRISSVVIPDSVTFIDEAAFNCCDGISSVAIPDSVTSIGGYAFSFCKSLKNISVSAGNTKYKDINGNLYTKDGKTLVQYAIGKTDTSFIILDTVTSICDSAFSGCSSLTAIVIPDGITSIGRMTFYNCISLTSVVIPDSVTSIGDFAFDECSKLKDVYYTGSEEEWRSISIGSFNSPLRNATIHYNYVPKN